MTRIPIQEDRRWTLEDLDSWCPKINKIIDKLSGNSKDLYRTLLKARTQDRPSYELAVYLSESDYWTSHIYFDYLPMYDVLTVIEAGTQNGKNVLECCSLRQDVEVYSFDPVPSADRRLLEVLESWENVHLYDYALWEHDGEVRLSKLPGGDIFVIDKSYVQPNSEEMTVKCIKLDTFVEQEGIEKIDFIKLDIEGSEMPAIMGAVKTLVEHRPKLAICIYHGKYDIVEIPIFLMVLLDDYTWSVGHYHWGLDDTVLYGDPR